MFWRSIVVSIALVLSGCGSSQNVSNDSFVVVDGQRVRIPASAMDNLEKMKRLDALADAGKISHVDATRQKKELALSGATYSAQVEAYWAKQLVIAEKLDNKQITKIEAEAMKADLVAGLERSSRVPSGGYQAPADDGGAAMGRGLQQAGNSLMQLDRQRMSSGPVINTPVNTRCNSFGNTMNCQTW